VINSISGRIAVISLASSLPMIQVKRVLRPGRLEGSKRREGMAGIADSRKTQQAHMLQRRFEV